jgi:hypothetical protein
MTTDWLSDEPEVPEPLPSPGAAPLHTDARDREFIDRLSDLALAGLAEADLKKLKKDFDDAATEALDRFEYYVKDDMAANLASYVADMASRSVKAMLHGNEAQMRRYLQCEQGGYNPRASSGLVNDTGSLFEYGGLELRRKLVDAYAELLKTERILDLEAQVKAAQEVIAKKNQELSRLREDAR